MTIRGIGGAVELETTVSSFIDGSFDTDEQFSQDTNATYTVQTDTTASVVSEVRLYKDNVTPSDFEFQTVFQIGDMPGAFENEGSWNLELPDITFSASNLSDPFGSEPTYVLRVRDKSGGVIETATMDLEQNPNDTSAQIVVSTSDNPDIFEVDSSSTNASADLEISMTPGVSSSGTTESITQS